jgi:NitT/TauT family transport system ATP-binding protein
MSVEFKKHEGIPEIIQLKDIRQTYDNNKVVVIDKLNLLVENTPGQNQLICLLGPSGCGKSTLLKYISGLKEPTDGEVYINGKLSNRDDVVGMVFQDYSSFPWRSVVQNVALGLEFQKVSAKECEEKAMDMLKMVKLDKQAKQFSTSLSGGQKQRVAIARSLLARPKILLMDEPFGALDTETRFEMQDLMQTLITEKITDTTIIFVTHDIPEAVFLSDEILLMQANPGDIVDRINIKLPEVRSKELKRQTKFTDIVYDIEDRMKKLNRNN